MANRFTDTEKWKDAWFCELSVEEKLFWIYLVDNCDNAGLWRVNWPLVKFFIPGFEFKAEKYTDRIIIVNEGLWFIKKFVLFQQKINDLSELNPDNNAHKSIISSLNRCGIKNEGLASPTGAPSQGPRYSKVKVRYSKVKVEEGGVGETKKDDGLPVKDSYKDFEAEVVGLWNSMCERHPQVSKINQISETRRKHLKKRFEEKAFRDFAAIVDAIENQPFLLNGNPDSAKHGDWRVNFDWLISNDNNYIKTLEWRYKNDSGIPASLKHLAK